MNGPDFRPIADTSFFQPAIPRNRFARRPIPGMIFGHPGFFVPWRLAQVLRPIGVAPG